MNSRINIFDFDGTITNETWPKFWVWVKRFGYHGEKRNDELEAALALYRSTHEGDSLETFFGFFNDLFVENNAFLTKEELMEGEAYIHYNPGLEEYLMSSLEKNYIVSGGLTDFLKGLKVAPYFIDIYGTPLVYREDGFISGIGDIMTDDKKILAIKEILKSNGREDFNCKNVCFIGDGYSDAPAMRFVHNHGGKAIFVHQPDTNDELASHNHKIYEMLMSEGIVDFSFVADYSSSSELFQILKSKEL